ncbi:MAG: KH domain-containing protein [Eubacterium sp.]|nr:KH domain-containing protein [Eubacterium sp.]
MLKEYIGTGKTIEDATAVAKAGLNAPLTADVKIEVIAMPQKKFLGLFGGADAQVKASYDDGVKEKKANKKQNKKNNAKKKEAPKKEAPKKEAPKAEVKSAPKKAENEVKEDAPKSVDLEFAKSYLSEILKGLNINDAKIDAVYENGTVTMDLDCEDFGIVIGRRGETLDSIQFLLSLVLKKKSNGYVRVSINVGDYREKRNETLRQLARKHAGYVERTGRRYTFEPMNPYERRIIHTTVQEIEGVESRSIGFNQDRRVVLEPTGGVKPRNDRGRRGSRPAPSSAPSSDRAPKADRADLPKFGKIEINKD